MQPERTGAAQDDSRALLERRREELLKRSRRVDRDLSRQVEPLVQDFADQAVQRQNDEALEAIGQAAAEELQQIERALERIEKGRYGLCEKCSQAIGEQRLRAVPYATTCIACG